MQDVDEEEHFTISNGEVVARMVSGAVHVKAVTPSGDPVELSEEEARAFARALLRMADIVE